MKHFPIVFQRELLETVRSKFFIATSIIFAVIVLISAAALAVLGLIPDNVGQLLPEEFIGITEDQSDRLTEYTIALDDRSGRDYLERLAPLTPSVEYQPVSLSDAQIRKAFTDGADGCITIAADGSMLYYISPFEQGSRLMNSVQAAFDQLARQDILTGYGLTPQQAAEGLGAASALKFTEVSRTDLVSPPEDYDPNAPTLNVDVGAAICAYLLSSMLFMAISFYGQMVSGRVYKEKSSRMVEVLATSATPTELLCGKVLGVGTAGFAQISVFYLLMFAIGSAAIGKLSRFSEYGAALLEQVAGSFGHSIVVVFIFFLLGFFQLAFIYGGLGAMSSDTEGISGLAALPLRLPMLGYMIAMMAPALGNSVVLRAASHLPFLAPFAMPARYSCQTVAVWELCLSVAIQLASIVLFAIASARLYRRGMLRYGQPPKLKELLSMIKNNN